MFCACVCIEFVRGTLRVRMSEVRCVCVRVLYVPCTCVYLSVPLFL